MAIEYQWEDLKRKRSSFAVPVPLLVLLGTLQVLTLSEVLQVDAAYASLVCAALFTPQQGKYFPLVLCSSELSPKVSIIKGSHGSCFEQEWKVTVRRKCGRWICVSLT